MEYRLTVSSTRQETGCIDLAESFKAATEDVAYSFSVAVELYAGEERVAHIWLLMFDESALLNNGYPLIEAADESYGDSDAAMSALCATGEYPSNWSELDCDKVMAFPLFIAYLERLYVSPGHRRKGYATYLLNNLEEILRFSLNAQLHWAVAIPKADGEEADKPAKGSKLLKSVLEKHGYRQLGDENAFARNYAIADEDA